jgi:hypothetical protein
MTCFKNVRGSHLQLPGAGGTAGRAGRTPVPGSRSHSTGVEACVSAAGESWDAEITVEHGSLAIKDCSTQAVVLQCQLAPDTVCAHTSQLSAQRQGL